MMQRQTHWKWPMKKRNIRLTTVHCLYQKTARGEIVSILFAWLFKHLTKPVQGGGHNFLGRSAEYPQVWPEPVVLPGHWSFGMEPKAFLVLIISTGNAYLQNAHWIHFHEVKFILASCFYKGKDRHVLIMKTEIYLYKGWRDLTP
jgi:hypothetical protein